MAKAPFPPTIPVCSLVDRNSVQPGPKRGIAPETGDLPEQGQENFLGHIHRLCLVVEQLEGKCINEAFVKMKCLNKRLFVPFL
jgi:hypothetical protein